MGGVHPATLDEACGQGQRHLGIVGVAAEPPPRVGEVPKLAVQLADLTGGTAFHSGARMSPQAVPNRQPMQRSS